MIKAYILINVRIGSIKPVLQNLVRLSKVQSAEMTFGTYDIITVVECPDLTALAKLVANEIQTIPDITQTTTCMAVGIIG